jgi:hypothetical protein
MIHPPYPSYVSFLESYRGNERVLVAGVVTVSMLGSSYAGGPYGVGKSSGHYAIHRTPALCVKNRPKKKKHHCRRAAETTRCEIYA